MAQCSCCELGTHTLALNFQVAQHIWLATIHSGNLQCTRHQKLKDSALRPKNTSSYSVAAHKREIAVSKVQAAGDGGRAGFFFAVHTMQILELSHSLRLHQQTSLQLAPADARRRRPQLVSKLQNRLAAATSGELASSSRSARCRSTPRDLPLGVLIGVFWWLFCWCCMLC